jgi:predicted enzyme related to lactoylglutathione lyase
MNLTLSQCFVLVHDPDSALAFYRDALGLELRNDIAKEDFRWITVGAAKGALNGVHFHTDDQPPAG